MLVGDLITDEIPPLKATDTVEMALDWMEQFKVSHLAVVNNRELIGIVAETDLMDYQHPEEPINASKLQLLKPIIHSHHATYVAGKLLGSVKLSLLSVGRENADCKGCSGGKGIGKKRGTLPALQNPDRRSVLDFTEAGVAG